MIIIFYFYEAMELQLISLVVCAVILLPIVKLVVVVQFVLLVLPHITLMKLFNAFKIVPLDGNLILIFNFCKKKLK